MWRMVWDFLAGYAPNGFAGFVVVAVEFAAVVVGAGAAYGAAGYFAERYWKGKERK